MLRLDPTPVSFSQAQARGVVKDLFEPRPVIYWSDFLATMAVGAAAFALVRRMPLFSWQQGALFVISCLMYYRASLFIHELVHLRSRTFGAFRVVWNLLCGIPFLMPSFLYYTHVDHHRRKHYGTDHDGEYLPLGTQSPWAIFTYLLQPFVIPLLGVLRFGLVGPLCWLSPRLRGWVARHASSMVMDPSYVRPLPTRQVRRIWRLQEALCFLYIVGATILIVRGRVPLPRLLLPQVYLTAVFILMINAVRTLGSHRFLGGGEEMTFVDQLLDSVNYPRQPLIAGLWGPVGTRFHALHHLFPALPYHNLAEAHRRLMAQLPADSAYRRTECRSLTAALIQLGRNASAARAARAVRPAAAPPREPVLAGPHTPMTPARHSVRQ